MLKDIVHTDLSRKFWEKHTTGIAVINSDRTFHRGLALSRGLKDKLEEKLDIRTNDSKLLAICIWHIIKDDQEIKEIIMCGDAPFMEVKTYLEKLFPIGTSMVLTPLPEIRAKIGKDIKSLAHGAANSYRKRGLKPWKKGKELNPVRLTYEEIIEYWNKLEE